MKEIIVHYDKTIVTTEDNIKHIETHLKIQQKVTNTRALKKKLQNNEANTIRLLQQEIIKKFNYLKHKTISRTEETPQVT